MLHSLLLAAAEPVSGVVEIGKQVLEAGKEATGQVVEAG